jgi:aminopeptidase N
MGSDLNERAWNQVVGALGTIEYAERGAPGHPAFVDFARSILRPVFAKLGWDGRPGEEPGTQRLRRTVIGNLGFWGDKEVIAEARQRFARFLKDRDTLKPDEQAVVMAIVARYADAATFRQLHAVAKSAVNETELRRYYTALMGVRDPALAESAAAIALSSEIPPQADSLRFWLVLALSDEHQKLAWDTFVKHLDALLAPHAPYGPLYVAQYGPGNFWSSVPLDQIESWVKANVPAEMTADVARGMETARFKIAEKSALVQATDHYLASSARPATAALTSGAMVR